MSNLLVEQMKAYAEYKSLMIKAEGIFPTTQMLDNWKDKLTSAFNSNEPLETFSFALTTFEAIQNNQSSPYFQKDLEILTQDPMFADFAEIAQDINTPYTQPAFSVSPTVSTAIAEENVGTDLNMFATEATMDETFAQSQLKTTNKVVLNVNGIGIVENPEALISSDGLVSKDNVTTNKIEQARQEMFVEQAEDSTPDELEMLVDSFNAESSVSMTDSSTSNVEDMPTNIDSFSSSSGNNDLEDQLDIAYKEAKRTLAEAGEGGVQEGGMAPATEAPNMCQ